MPYVVDLVFPVGHEHGDVVQPQHHVRVFFEHLPGDVFVVLTADRKDNAPLLELFQPRLQLGERPADAEPAYLNVLQPVVADHATPQSVVQVEDHCLVDPPPQRLDDVEHPCCDFRPRIQCIDKPGRGVRRGRDDVSPAGRVLKQGEVGNEEIRYSPGQVHQPQVDGANLERKGQPRLIRIIAIDGIVDFGKVAIDDLALQAGIDRLAQTLDMLQVRCRERCLLLP